MVMAVRRATTLFIVLATIVLMLIAAPASAALPPGGTFVDDDGNIHEADIEAIAAEGITKGCNPPWNDEYCPKRTVTRAEIGAMVVRALGLTDDGGKDWFTDDDGQWYEDSLNKLAAAGITKGCNADGSQFCPTREVTRGEFAAFLVRAYGYSDPGPEDRFIDDDDSIFEGDIQRLAQAGVTKGCNPPDNNRFCPDGRLPREQIASFFTRAEGLTPNTPPERPDVAIETVVSGLSGPLDLAHPAGDSRLFVAEKGGRIKIIDGGAVLPTPFLDISSLVSNGGEQGLLGIAFHPDYGSNGRFYVHYTDTNGDSRVVEYTVSGNPNVADPGSARSIIRVAQYRSNHNGGMIDFDPSGNLLIALGDGGGAGDPLDNGENPNTLLGTILRIGVDGDDFNGDTVANYTIPSDNPFVGSPSARDEVWAYGLRNPWKFSIDGPTGLLYIADVGQKAREEVNVQPVTEGGVNYGWNELEGSLCHEPASGCSSAGTVLPVVEYGRGGGCSVTGGYVYRDDEVTQLIGHYVYADFCAGVLRSFRYHPDAGVDAERVWSDLGSLGQVTSFGLGADGSLYVVIFDGRILRLTTD